jgi:hypothetical protein
MAMMGIFTGTKPEALNGANMGSLVSGCRLEMHAYFIRHSSAFEYFERSFPVIIY